MRIDRPSAPGDLSDRVARVVREQIAAGRLAPGNCVLSERELSLRMKVSRGTVRRGLERLVRDGLLRREAGRGYSLGGAAGPAGGEGARNAVVFVHHLSEEELASGQRHAQIWAGAREEAARSGLLTMISSISVEELTAEKAAELAKVSGGVLCDHPGPESARALLAAGIPVVQMDYYPDGSLPVDAVVQDDSGGIEMAVRHLHGRGHRRIGYLDTTGFYRSHGRPLNAARRLSGFASACAALGADVAGLIEECGEEPRAATARLLERGATALVVPHSDLWPGVRSELSGRGVKLPGDFGAVLWGGEQLAAGEEIPTYITWNKEQMGREGVRRLVLRMGRQGIEPAVIVIPATLVDRGTGGRGPAH